MSEQAAVAWRAAGTFAGPAQFEGLNPTGARVEIEGIDMLTVREGKIHQNLAYTNGAELGRQLGRCRRPAPVGEKLLLARSTRARPRPRRSASCASAAETCGRASRPAKASDWTGAGEDPGRGARPPGE